jgi:glycosyltransferase involved in cell wall biosynthesis
MLSDVSWPGLTPPGDVDAFVDAVLSVLDAPAERYAQLSREARQIAMGFRWRAIARQTVALYEQRLEALHRVGARPRRCTPP